MTLRLGQRLKYLDNDPRVWLQVRTMAFFDRLEARRTRRWSTHLSADVKCYCTFVGYPRSGHSLVASILDAHPHAAFSHRLDALRYIERGVTAGELFQMIWANSRRFSRAGRRLTGYAYPIPGQWQGLDKSVAVIGDQEARWATLRLKREPKPLGSFASEHSLTLKFIHVIRHPLDNISTWANRSQRSLHTMTDRYFELCEGVRVIRQHFGSESMLDIYLEDLIERPEAEIGRLCSFLALQARPDFVENSGRIVYKKPNRSRHTRSWPDGLVAKVARQSATHDFLARYDFAEDTI